MKISEIASAYPYVVELGEYRLGGALSRQVYKMRLAMEQECSYYDEERKKIIQEYAAKRDDGSIVADERGAIVFDDDEKKSKCMAELTDLGSTDVDLPPIIYIPAAIIDTLDIKPNLLWNLRGIVECKE